MRLTTIVAIAAISLFSHTWADGMNYWIGPNNNSWDTAGANWSLGYVPGADDTAVFTNDYRLIKIKSGHAASNVVFEAGSRVRFSRTDGGAQAAFGFKEINGGGKLELFSTGLQANYASFAECPVSVSEIEIINDTSYSTKVSWFDGGSNEGSRMIVGSSVSGAGKLECRGNVTLAGETTATGSLKLDSGSVVKKLVYDNGGCNVTSDSAGTVEQVLVRGGTLAYSSSALAAATGVSVGRFALEGGTLSVGGDFSGKVASGTGFGTLFLEGDWADADSVALPSGISFVDGEDAARLDVRAAVAGREHRFSVAESGGGYVLETKGAIWNIDALDFSLMTILAGQGSPKANKSINGNSIRLWDGEKAVTFSRGIGTHAPSRWFVKLGGKGISMSVCVGVDYEAYGKTGSGDGKSPNVNFIILDVERGLKLAESGEMTDATPYKRLTVDLAGVETIELVMDGLDSTSWDHADWADGVILMEPGFSPVTKGENGVNRWTGSGENDYWATPENWEFGVPAADATAVFDESATVRIGQTGENSTTPEKVTVSNVVVNSGATLTLRPVSPEFWDGPELIVQEVSGAGKIQLAKVGIKANYVGDSTECTVNVAEIEALKTTRWYDDIWSWLNGGNSDGKKMVVKSKVTGNGWLSFEGNVQVDGTVYITHKLTFGENVNKPTYCFTTENFSFADKKVNDEVVANKGSVGCIYIKGGVFTPSAYEGLFTSYVLDGGTLNVAGVASSVSVLSGGFLRWTVGEAFGDSVPDWPAGLALSFVDGASATLADVYAVVTDAAGAQRTYSISESGGVYSLEEAQPSGDQVVWIGGGSNNKWENGANWQFGAVPTADQTAVFEANADVVVNIDIVGGVQIADGATVTLRSSNGWADPKRFLTLSSAAGEGRLALSNVQLIGNNEASATVIDVAELEILREIRWGADGYSDYPASMLSSRDGKTICVKSPIVGGGDLECYMSCDFAGDNSRFTGTVTFITEHNSGWSSRLGDEFRFCVPQAGFRGAAKCAINGRFHIAFTEGTIRFGNVSWKESWGTGIYMPYGTTAVTIEVSGGEIYNSYQGSGFGVFTRAEGSDGVDGATDGCAGLTIKKVGEGTLVYGVTKAHNLVVAEGRVEFTGENNNGDDADVNVTVKAGASIGTPEAFSHENPNWTLGGDVTVRHQFAFEPGAAIKQEYIATTTTDEQTQEETTTYSMRKLTIARDVDLANVVFGVTNPEDLPAVTKAVVAGLPRFTMFAANSLSGAVATENGGYTPTGSEKNGSWIARPSRTVANTVEFRPYIRSGLAVIIR